MFPPKSRRAWGALIVVMLSIAFTLVACQGRETRAASYLVPDSAIAYVSATMPADPVERARLLAVAGLSGESLAPFDGVAKSLIARFFPGEVDFASDLDPWMGREISAAVLPAGDGHETVAFLSVDDDQGAREALERLGVSPKHWRLVGTHAVIAPSALPDDQASSLLDGVDGATRSLEARPDFQKVTSQVDTDSLVAGWLGPDAFALPLVADVTQRLPALAQDIEEFAAPLGAVGFGIELDGTQLRVSAVSEHSPHELGLASRSQLLRSLPADTAFAIDVADAGAWSDAFDGPSTLADFSVPDLLDVARHETVIAGSATGDLVLVSNVRDVAAAQRDVDAQVASLRSKKIAVEPLAGTSLFVARDASVAFGIRDGRLYVATSADYLKRVIGASDELGVSETYLSLLGDISDSPVAAQIYVDFEATFGSEPPLPGIHSLGATLASDGVHTRLDLRLSLDD